MLVITVLLCIFFVASGIPTPEQRANQKQTLHKRDIADPVVLASETGNANDFVDMLLENVKNNPETPLDPFILPERGISFNKTVILLPVSGEIKIHKGIVTGISTLHRTGDCTMSYDRDVLHVKVKLGMGVLKVKGTGTVKFMGLGPSVDCAAEVGFADIDMALAVDIATLKATVTKFKLNTLKGIKATISGLGPLNYLINFFSGIVTSLFKNTLKFVVEIVMGAIIKQQLAKMRIPM